MIDPRTPVLVGVGTSFADGEAVELMVDATESAAADTGAGGIEGARRLLAAVQRIAVPRGTWGYTDPARLIGERIGATDALTVLVDLGIPQQTLINETMTAIARGETDVALVVGAEAKARAARIAKRSTAANAAGISQVMRRERDTDGSTEVDQGGATPDVHQMPGDEIVARAEIEAGLWAPVEQYALMETALGAAEGRTVTALRRDIAELYARFNEVARTNPEAAFPAPMTVDMLATFGPHQRPLAFPYGKWHASQWTVDQGAALLLCSAEAAERFRIPRDRWIFPLVGLDSSFSMPLTKRRELHRWPAMRLLGQAAAARIGRPLAECDHAEVYSCFPVAVRVQQRELGLPLDGTPTITGGMSFAGGPFNSYVLQSTAAMVRRLREQEGLGLVTTVSGLLTKPGLAVWSSTPDDQPPLIADLRVDAAAATRTSEVLSSYTGDATVAAYTVTYDGMEPTTLVSIIDTPTGERALAKSKDSRLIARATNEGLVGESVTVTANELDA